MKRKPRNQHKDSTAADGGDVWRGGGEPEVHCWGGEGCGKSFVTGVPTSGQD